MPDAAALHADAVVVNGLTTLAYPPGAGRGEWTDESFPAVMRAGGMSAANVTLAVREDFEAAALAAAAMVRAYDGRHGMRIARTAADVTAAEPACILGFQNSDALEGDLRKLEFFHTLGVRIIQLTYQTRNLAGDGSSEAADGGLSNFGRALISAMNELGVVIDLAHAGPRTTLEAIEHSEKPVVISHANVHALHPHIRNKTDEELRALAAAGGVIGITAISRFMDPDGVGVTLERVLDHVEYVAELVGPGHVGIGLDVTEGLTPAVFDEQKRPLLTAYPELAGGLVYDAYYAEGLGTMAAFPVVTAGLLARGVSERDVRAIVGGNFLRVFDQAWSAAYG